MSQLFLTRFVNFVQGFLLLMLIGALTSTMAFLYIITKEIALLYSFEGLFALLTICGLYYYKILTDMKGNIHLFIPETPPVIVTPEPLVGDPNVVIAVCKYYSRGASLRKIGADLHIDDPTQVKRMLKQGLKTLMEAKQ